MLRRCRWPAASNTEIRQREMESSMHEGIGSMRKEHAYVYVWMCTHGGGERKKEVSIE